MDLVLVESPTKERTISKFVKKTFVVKSSYGHIRDLPKSKLGVDISKNFKPDYSIIPRAKKIIRQLTSLTKKATKVYLATDFDREGEAIAWHLVNALKLNSNKLKRITFHEITPEAIKKAFKKPRPIDLNLVNSQQARRVLDRLVGYKLSPLLWRKVRTGISAGRVQSVAVRLICDREKEINKFVPQEYWTLKVELDHTAQTFFAILVEKDKTKLDKFAIKTKSQAQEIVDLWEGKKFEVVKVEKAEKLRHPHPPFTTASLQQESVRSLRFSAAKTMVIAQQLYEGINLGGNETIGLITYMRSDSTNVAMSAQLETQKFIKEKFGEKYLPPKMRRYKTKQKTAQEAHEAIRPTGIYREPGSIKNYLTPEQYRLYSLIWTRFLSSQMADAKFDATTVDIICKYSPDGVFLFRAAGRAIKFDGFLKILSPDTEKQFLLPLLKEGLIMNLIKSLPEQHFTEPPPRYTEASLIRELEKNDIGRPSTYVPIVETIRRRGYVKLSEYKFFPTELGVIVDELLRKHFSEIVDINFTARVEKRLDSIAHGDISWNNVVSEFYSPFERSLKTAEKKITKIKKAVKTTDEKCSKCGAVMHLRESLFGKFLSCSNWPKCKNKIPLDKSGNKKSVEKTDKSCPKCGKMLVKRTGKWGVFLACSGYPRCRHTEKFVSQENNVK